MLTPYVRQHALAYAANLRRRLKRKESGATDFVEWVTENAGLLRIDFSPTAPPGLSETAPSTADWRRLATLIDDARRRQPTQVPDAVGWHLQRLGENVALGPIDLAILELLLLYDTAPVVESLMDAVFCHRRHRHLHPLNLRGDALPCALGESPAAIRRCLAPDAPLVRTGLVAVEEDQDVRVASRLRRLTGIAPKSADVRELLLGKARKSKLEWSDFDHLGQSRDDAAMLLEGALRRSASGVNVLVYGPPGTGKTEFCHVVARQVGAELFSVGESDDDGGEPSRRERLQELCLAQSLLREERDALLLFDEMEDLLADFGRARSSFPGLSDRRSRGGGSKVYMNRLLEDAPTPTLWTTNDVRGINPAIVRRMLLAVEMRQPPPRIRARIWSRQLAARRIAASAEDARVLANEFDATPGVAAGAVAAADLSDGGFDVVRRGVRSLSRALGHDKPAQPASVAFDPVFAVADIDLAALADRLADSGETRFSLCLQGPPGTGKSAYARHLADRLGMAMLHKRSSDLLSMWVGETEANIAAAFAEARDECAFLILDEADSLLADRRGADRQWEVSQVNEMLTWMESHPLPFACTTNYAERLDSATLRRFVFKATFRFLPPATLAHAFRAWFELDAPPAVCRLANLTPGDFDVVRRKAALLGQERDPDALAEMLKAESEAKPGQTSCLGFAA